MNTNFNTTIVCGTDFSDGARRAATAAAALAQRLGVPLRLVHVSAIPGSPLTHDHLNQEAQRLQATGADLTTEVREGSPANVLAHIAEQYAVGLIVVSSTGLSAPSHWVLGSVAERTAESSSVPTLVVHDAAPFEAWARGERALKIFVGTDFSASADAALRWAGQLRQFGPIDIVAGYVDWPPEEAARLGITGPLGLVGNPPKLQGLLERDLLEKVTRLVGTENVRIEVRGNWGRLDSPLVAMAIDAQADVIVVGTHQRHGLGRLHHGSISRAVLRHAPMSVACVPAPVAARIEGPRLHECKRVLVAVDLNEPYGFAASHGYSIVQPGGTVRLLFNGIPDPLSKSMAVGAMSDGTSKSEYAQGIAQSEAKLRALAPPEAQARNILTEVEVTENRETDVAICTAAERFGADVICIGSHTRPGFTAKVLGSVALRVLQGSRRPVLVVWPPAA
jgi:nucleotide-binding universal stress UspA family protein